VFGSAEGKGREEEEELVGRRGERKAGRVRLE
jgi:hypothetical protein